MGSAQLAWHDVHFHKRNIAERRHKVTPRAPYLLCLEGNVFWAQVLVGRLRGLERLRFASILACSTRKPGEACMDGRVPFLLS